MLSYRKSLDSINAYVPGKTRPNAIKLSSNENAWGVSPMVQKVLLDSIKKVNIYPESTALCVRKELSKLLNVPKENIVLGTGSNELIDIVMRIFMGAGGEAISGEWSFAVYRIVSKVLGKDLIMASAPNYKNNVKNIINAINDNTSMIIIDNPGNPIGTYLSIKEIEKLIEISEEKNIILLVDEAYFEFVRADDYQSAISLIQKHKNLIVARTFSKAYGLSGLRIGYMIANTWIIDLMNKVRPPFNVGVFAQASAVAVLKDKDFLKMTVKNTHIGMDYLMKELSPYLDIIPSQTNFIMAKLKEKFANKDLAILLEENNIIIRPLGAYKIKDYSRITIGTMEQNKKLVEIIKKHAKP